ncbi:phosphatase inhibitor-domain-containing protein, partial [Cladorrhinum sp. PSN259]
SYDTPCTKATMASQAAQQPRSALSSTQTAQPLARTQTEPQAILRLRGAHVPTRRSVQWDSNVVDNEGLNRKKSKVCCIYHRPKGVDESSDESSSDSSDSDSGSDSGRDKGDADRTGKGGRKHSNCSHSHGGGRGRGEGSSKRRRKPSPNAYEKMPNYGSKPDKSGGNGSGGGSGGGNGNAPQKA